MAELLLPARGDHLPAGARGSITAKYRNTIFWAENGSILWIDELTGKDGKFEPHQGVERIAAFQNALNNSRGVKKDATTLRSKAYWDLQAYVQDMDAVIRHAREQGTFFDPSARRARVRAAPKTFAMNGLAVPLL